MSEEEAKKRAPLMLEAQEMLRRWEARDPEVYGLWEMMNGWVYDGFDVTYKALGVDFDKVYYESQTYLLGKDIVQKGLDMGIFYRREDGSVWIDLTADGLDQKLLLRGDGTSVYMTQDLGTAFRRFEDNRLDDMIYVVGNEQNYHFQVLSLLLELSELLALSLRLPLELAASELGAATAELGLETYSIVRVGMLLVSGRRSSV